MDDAPEKEESSQHWIGEGETSSVSRDEQEFARQLSKGKSSGRGTVPLCRNAGQPVPRLTRRSLPAHRTDSQLTFLFTEALLFVNSFHRPSELGSSPYNHPHFYRQRNKGCPRGGKFRKLTGARAGMGSQVAGCRAPALIRDARPSLQLRTCCLSLQAERSMHAHNRSPEATQPARGSGQSSVLGCPAPKPTSLSAGALPLDMCRRVNTTEIQAVKLQVSMRGRALQGDHRGRGGMWLQERGCPVQDAQLCPFRAMCVQSHLSRV